MEWASKLQPEIQVLAVQTPGHGIRFAEHPYFTIPEIVADVVTNLPIVDGQPFALYGHSLGAVVAFEVARQLRREGKPGPCHLFAGGARPPHFGPVEPRLHDLDEQGFLDGVQARYSGIPAAVLDEPELLAILLPALRADFAAYETYVHQSEPPLACPITAFTGADDPLAHEAAMCEWNQHTSANFNLTVLPGGHFFLKESGGSLTSTIKRILTDQLGANGKLAGKAEAEAAHNEEMSDWQPLSSIR
jgi:surfactin synthase thioesterase subunit